MSNVDVQNLDFLKSVDKAIGLDLSIQGRVRDWSALEAVAKYDNLCIMPADGDISQALPFLQKSKIQQMRLENLRGLDLSALPPIANKLEIASCDLKDLSGIPKTLKITTLRIEDLEDLTSLEGIQPLFKKTLSMVQVLGCPRLTDWSALYGQPVGSLQLIGVYSLPDLSRMQLRTLFLNGLTWLEDLTCLDGLDSEKSYALQFPGLENVKDLSPVRRLNGSMLVVPPHLKEQAASLVEEGRFRQYDIAYPDSGWESWNGEVRLKSLEDLDTLPWAALAKVENLQIAGDSLVPDNCDLWDRWDDREQRTIYTIHNRETDEEWEASPGTMTDLSKLTPMKGLRRLQLNGLPVTSLAGIESMKDLEEIDLRNLGQLTDLSALFTLENVRRINLFSVPADSIQGIQNLYRLQELYVCQTNIYDFSPLAECDLSEAYANNGLTLDINNENAVEDLSFLESIRRFNYLPLGGRNYTWLSHLQGAEIENLVIEDAGEETDLTCLPKSGIRGLQIDRWGKLKSLNGLEELISSGGLETLIICGCPRIRDWSALEAGYIPKLWLRGTYMIPDLAKVRFGTLRLENMRWLKDLNALSTIDTGREIDLELVNLPQLKDLSALKKLKGNRLAVSDELMNKARAIVESGSFRYTETADAEGWYDEDIRINIDNLADLEELPESVLENVDRLAIAGDVVYDPGSNTVDINWGDHGEADMELRRFEDNNRVPVDLGTMKDLTPLAKLTGLRELQITGAGFSSLDGIENLVNLERLQIVYAPNLKDASKAYTLKNMQYIEFNQTGLETIEGIENLPLLREFLFYGYELEDISPLGKANFSSAYRNGGLTLALETKPGADMSPLQNIREFNTLRMWGHEADQWLPYLQNAKVHTLVVSDCSDMLALDRLPAVTDRLEIHKVYGLKNLTGLKGPGPRVLQLDALTDLTSLEGIHDLVKAGGIRTLEVGGCPRLTDWSALESAQPEKLIIFGDLVPVPENLQGIAEKTDGSGEWWEHDVRFTPESLEELGILPPAVKAGIREIKIIGDGIYDDSEYFLETRWIKVNGKNRLVAGPRHRDEQDITQVQTGTMTDLSVLEGMENLETLKVGMQPLTSLAGIEKYRNLRTATFCCCYDLEDITALFRLDNLEQLDLEGSGVKSIEGISGMKPLRWLSLNNTEVTDLSPLAGMANLEGLCVTNDKIKDFSPLGTIPRFNSLEMGGIDSSKWANALNGVKVEKLRAHNFKSQKDFEAFMAEHPEIEELGIPDNGKITDLGCLAEMPNLRRVAVSGDMKKAIRSLEGKEYRFQLEIE